MTPPDYFSTAEAASRYGLSASWLAKLRVYGGGPEHFKLGRRVLYSASAFDDWFESNKRNNTSTAA